MKDPNHYRLTHPCWQPGSSTCSPVPRSWVYGSPTRPQAGPGPVERSQPPPPARGRPAEEGPLFPGAPGGCEPPGKAPARNSSSGLGQSCPTPAPATQRGRRRPGQGQEPRTPRQPGPGRQPRVTAVKPPPLPGRADGAPTCTQAEGRAPMSRDNDQGAQMGPKGPLGLCEDPGGASPPGPGAPPPTRLPGVRLPPERAGARCCRVGGPGLPALPPGACSRASRSRPPTAPGHRAPPGPPGQAADSPATRPSPAGRRRGRGRGCGGRRGRRRLGARRLQAGSGPASATRPAHDAQAPPTAAGAGQVPTVCRCEGRCGGHFSRCRRRR
ncbi:collagen alpha-1(I) chain-like [Zalophus californianus]|uniref:Collagen alpha-1(I) chain-like n=1 Tax=Zalophus californianus TaxID=9704 RepID=A0A6J2C019_ZALCA|nr:collagen alpha-1(I) chain-like [Zalophus californianus]